MHAHLNIALVLDVVLYDSFVSVLNSLMCFCSFWALLVYLFVFFPSFWALLVCWISIILFCLLIYLDRHDYFIFLFIFFIHIVMPGILIKTFQILHAVLVLSVTEEDSSWVRSFDIIHFIHQILSHSTFFCLHQILQNTWVRSFDFDSFYSFIELKWFTWSISSS